MAPRRRRRTWFRIPYAIQLTFLLVLPHHAGLEACLRRIYAHSCLLPRNEPPLCPSPKLTDSTLEKIMPVFGLGDRFKADPNDLIIVVMGPTGSGKTNFINTLTGNPEKPKASELDSATQNITPYPVQHHTSRLVLVDTPGFDDTHRPDMAILKMIADWLTKKYPDGGTLRLAGIVYLHRITDNRMSGSAHKNLQMFGRLCGNVPLRHARLVTTMWDKMRDKQTAESREKELIDDFWHPLIAEGAVAKRFDNNHASALQIVDDLIDAKSGKDELLLQEELVEQKKRLNETEAGKVLYSRFQKLLAEQRNTLKELADEAKMQNDPSLASSLQEEYERVNAMLQNTFEEMKAMKIPLSRRILLWLFGRKAHAKPVEVGELSTT